jgi:putative intracellular protease/amidase
MRDPMSKRVLLPLPDRDFDATETSVPWRLLTRAGHQVVFATEHGGEKPACDPRTLNGVLLGMFGPHENSRQAYRELTQAPEFAKPIAWDSIDVSAYDGLLLPGGHAPGMRQYLGSERLQRAVADFWQLGRPVAAICHGVIVLARARDPKTGKSVLASSRTTCLPKYMERTAYLSTAPILGRYYRTYPAYVEDEVKAALDDPERQFERGPRVLNMRRVVAGNPDNGFVVEDGRYVSARWPSDAQRFGQRFIALLEAAAERSAESRAV